jgi:hypothetical protein
MPAADDSAVAGIPSTSWVVMVDGTGISAASNAVEVTTPTG